MDSKYSSIENGSSNLTSFNFHGKRKNNCNGNGNFNGNKHPSPKKMKSAADSGNGTGGSSQNGSSQQSNGSQNGNNNNNNGHYFKNVQSKSLQEQRNSLPVASVRTRLIQEISTNKTLILIGETGSGKTTQIPQFLHETGLTKHGAIAVTQPRRVAAITVAKRVAQEKECVLGELVGYAVRFENVTSSKTKIKYMTDGSLLREALSDELLLNYRVVILDEAHERTISTDVLFGIVKKAQKIRDKKQLLPLKLIIMSATMDVDHFRKYFDSCPAIYMEGRTFPVTVYQAKRSTEDYLDSCLITLFQIHKQAAANEDVLMFLTGQDEIEAMATQIRSVAKLNEIKGPIIKVFPLYSQLPQHQQLNALKPSDQGTRKVVLATNIAETSLTISGIKYVIDSGVVKSRIHDPTTGMDTLKIVKISQAQATQRTGRVGRESEGICFRTYTKDEFENMEPNTVPEILRCNITATVLQLLALGIDVRSFDFIDLPSEDSIEFAIKELFSLGAICGFKSPILTELGKNMSKFPLDPKYSKMLLSATEYGCMEEMLSLVSILSSENIFVNVNDKRDQSLAAHSKFYSQYGDHLTLLNVYKAFCKTERVKMWCHDNFLNARNLQYAREVRAQLLEICERCDIEPTSCGSNLDQVRRCLLTGLFSNLAELQSDKTYLTLSSRQRAKIHPSSVLSNTQLSPCVLFSEILSSGKNYLKLVTIIEPNWVQEMVPNTIIVNKVKFFKE